MVRLKEVQDLIWNVIYCETSLGRFSERTYTVTAAQAVTTDCS